MNTLQIMLDDVINALRRTSKSLLHRVSVLLKIKQVKEGPIMLSS